MENKKIGVPMEGLAQICRKAAAQGAVLLKNENRVLPFKKGEKIAVFGRCQTDYYRSGTGSGGSVNVAYTTNLLDGLRSVPDIAVDETLAEIYENYRQEHPFDNGGGGWAAEPWFQQEMPLTDEIASGAALRADKAVVVIGRTAGEDKDNADEPGSYRLTEAELLMLEKVCAHFENVVVTLNVSNIIDMSFALRETCQDHIKAILYLWHGGMEGGNAAADVLTGRVNPSGRLSDTIAYSLADYPSTEGYGDRQVSYYKEDIYVGYRYFETFAGDRVQYPFGFGLSYTTFSTEVLECVWGEESFRVTAEVENTGKEYSGREVVQVYVSQPQGKLGKAAKVLAGFAKTGLLAPGEKEKVEIQVPFSYFASYDDSGCTGAKSCYVLEEGTYLVYVGSNVRDVVAAGEKEFSQLQVIERLQEASAPDKVFRRLKPGQRKTDGTYEEEQEPVPVRTIAIEERIRENLPGALPLTGDVGIRFADVKAGKAELDDFVAQFDKEDLAAIVRGEGMCSPKVTPGCAAAFGGVTDKLLSYGVPLGCAADGPSGIRMDNGAKATQVPIGTLLACSFDLELTEELFDLLGQELVRNEIDTLLGPGINIHRNPLNGRNFEYFSEDPLLTGKMAAAVVRGIARHGARGTVKHYACNNQETARHTVDAIVSERAQREIYLKGFELAVKEGGAVSIMSSYNPINGYQAASHYDLDHTILRKEWGYQGILMTDWWAKMNDVVQGGESNLRDTRSMVRAGNDLYMVVNNFGAELNPHEDNLMESLENGTLTLGELQACAKNIIRFLLGAPASFRPIREPEIIEVAAADSRVGESETQQPSVLQEQNRITVPVPALCGEYLSGEKKFSLFAEQSGVYEMSVKVTSREQDLAQMACQARLNGTDISTFQINGTWGRWQLQKLAKVRLEAGWYELSLVFVRPGMEIEKVEFRLL